MGNKKVDTCIHLDSKLIVSPIAGQKSTSNLVLYSFSWFDVLVVFVSMATYIADIITDILVTILYWKINEVIWAALTVFFLVFPSIIMQIFSTRWFQCDGRKITFPLILIHVCMMGPIMRYCCVLKHGFKARKTKNIEDYQKTYCELSDASMLRLIESFLESAPQLVLQLYIIIKVVDNDHILTGISAFFSLISLSWAIAAYTKALRMAVFHSKSGIKKRKVTWTGLFVQTTWRVGMVASRLCALVLFATVYPYWLLGVVLVHWIAMTVWQIVQDTDFCTTIWEERLFNSVIGFVHIFCFINMKEGNSRYRVIPYYILMFVENSVMIIVWWIAHEPGLQYEPFGMLIVWGGFLIGVVAMVLYHQYFHPSSKKRCHCCMAYYHFLYKCCPCYNSKVSFNHDSVLKDKKNVYSNINTSGSPTESSVSDDLKSLVMPEPNATSTPADFLESPETLGNLNKSPEMENIEHPEVVNGEKCSTLVRDWVNKARSMNLKTKGTGLNGTLLLQTPKQSFKNSNTNNTESKSDSKPFVDTIQKQSVVKNKVGRKCDSRPSFRKAFGFQDYQSNRTTKPITVELKKMQNSDKNFIKARIDRVPDNIADPKLDVITEVQLKNKKCDTPKAVHKKCRKFVWKEPVAIQSNPILNQAPKSNIVFDIPVVNEPIISPYDNVSSVKNMELKENIQPKTNLQQQKVSTKVRKPLGNKNMNSENQKPKSCHRYKPVQSDRVEYLYKLGKNGFMKKCEESPARRQLSYSREEYQQGDCGVKMTKSIEGLSDSADIALQNSTSYRVHLI